MVLLEIAVKIGAANVTLDLQGSVQTVTFDDNGNSNQGSGNSNMKAAIDTALSSNDKANTLSAISLRFLVQYN